MAIVVPATPNKDDLSMSICEFLLRPSGKTIAEEEEENPEEEQEPEEEDEEEEEEEEVKPKGRKGGKNSAGRPKRATAGRSYTKGLSYFIYFEPFSNNLFSCVL